MSEALLNPYCYADDVRAELRNDDSVLADEINRAINAASRWIDEWLGRDFYFHDFSQTPIVYTKWSPEVVGDTIFLQYRPVITLGAVTITNDDETPNDVYILGTDFFAPLNKKGQITTLISLDGDWPALIPPFTVTVAGTFGYPQTDANGSYSAAAVPTGLPDEIRQACRLIAAAFSAHNQKEIIGVDGQKQAITDKTIPKAALAILGGKKPFLI